MNKFMNHKQRALKWLLLSAIILVFAGSLPACGKKGNLKKPGKTTEQAREKT